jgi:hypothetical protein
MSEEMEPLVYILIFACIVLVIKESWIRLTSSPEEREKKKKEEEERIQRIRERKREEEKQLREEERRKSEKFRQKIEEKKRIKEEGYKKEVFEEVVGKTFKILEGNWLGKTRDGFVEIIFEDENRLMIIQNEMDVLSLTYKIISVDEEIILEVNDEGRVSQTSLRFMKDGRLHFKSNQLEMVLSKGR